MHAELLLGKKANITNWPTLSVGSFVGENTHTLNTCRSQEDKLGPGTPVTYCQSHQPCPIKQDFWAPQAQLFGWGSRLSSHCPLVRLGFFHTALFCVGQMLAAHFQHLRKYFKLWTQEKVSVEKKYGYLWKTCGCVFFGEGRLCQHVVMTCILFYS